MTVSGRAAAAVEPRLQAAINEVRQYDGVNLDVVAKSKSLIKFGRHPALGTTREMVWSHAEQAGEETLLTTNGITHAVSSSNADIGVAMSYEYHTLSGGDLTFGVGTYTCNGQTPVELPVPAARNSRIRNESGTPLVGDHYLYEGGAVTAGVPDDPTEVHGRILAGDQQTRKMATSISSVDYWFITMWPGQLLGSNTARVAVELEKRALDGVWLPTGIQMGLGTQGTIGSPTELPGPVIIIPANHDIRAMAVATAAGTVVEVYAAGYLASVIS